jgi:hypothetical protein
MNRSPRGLAPKSVICTDFAPLSGDGGNRTRVMFPPAGSEAAAPIVASQAARRGRPRHTAA